MCGHRFGIGPGRSRDGAGRLVQAIAVLVVLDLAVGCASPPSRSRESSPLAIVVRNACPIDLQRVSLRGPALSDGQSDWLGAISPVPRGTAQMLGQRSATFPWPDVVEIIWVDDRQRQYSRRIAMEPLLKQATGEVIKILVVEIRPAGQLVVYWQPDTGRDSPR